MKTTMGLFAAAVLLFCHCPVLYPQEAEVFSIGSLRAAPGEMVTGSIPVPEGSDQGSSVPVTIIRGARSGPVLTLGAGIHGTEYVPVIVLQKLAGMIDPAELSGTLILLHICNLPGFLDKEVYNSPVDKKNMNRVFPGDREGTLSKRPAHVLTTEVLSRSDFYIDLHGGEFNEQVIDYLYYYYNCPFPDQDEENFMLAHALGNKYLFPYDYTRDDPSLPSEYTDTEALRQGASAITLEWGDRGAVLPEEVEHGIRGMVNIMRKLGMLEGETFSYDTPVYLKLPEYFQSSYDGIFYPLVERGQYVTKGTRLGYTTDFWGKVVEEFHAPFAGIVVLVMNAPSMKKGQNTVSMSEVMDAPPRVY